MRLRRRKNKPVKITGVGQLFDLDGEELMLSMIEWNVGGHTEVRLTSTKGLRHEA